MCVCVCVCAHALGNACPPGQNGNEEPTYDTDTVEHNQRKALGVPGLWKWCLKRRAKEAGDLDVHSDR